MADRQPGRFETKDGYRPVHDDPRREEARNRPSRLIWLGETLPYAFKRRLERHPSLACPRPGGGKVCNDRSRFVDGDGPWKLDRTYVRKVLAETFRGFMPDPAEVTVLLPAVTSSPTPRQASALRVLLYRLARRNR